METGLRRLRYFAVLASELNFRSTAKRLNITQPALSRAIVQLETEVGTQLLERTNRRVRLTLAGETFAEGCDRLLGGLGATIEQTRKVADGYAGNLVVGYTDTAISGRLPDLIRSFLVMAPEIHIRLIQIFTDRQLEMLKDGSIDIGLMTGPVAQDGVEAVDVQIDRFVALLPRENPLAAGSGVCLRALEGLPFVLGDLDAWRAYNTQLFALCERAGVRPQIVQTAPESRAIIGLVTCGLGVSVLPESLTRGVDPRVVALPIRDLNSRVRTQAVWSRSFTKPALANFVAHVSRC